MAILGARLFVDTSAWYALADTADPNHSRARPFYLEALRRYVALVTTNHVVGEAFTLLRRRFGPRAGFEFHQRLLRAQRLQWVFVTQPQEDEAYRLIEQYADQDFSFVDGTSFVIMRTLGIQEAFAFDHHFAAAGFVLLPESA